MREAGQAAPRPPAAAPRPALGLDARRADRLKPLLWVLGLFPLARWLWLGTHDGLTANPVEFLTRSSGLWTLVCLLATLAITPLRRLLGAPALVRWRRLCGLFTFFYASLHMLAWAWWDQALALASMLADALQRPFVAVGLAAYTLMALLALTSTRGWMRRLGGNWQRLHRAVYLIGALAIVHYWQHKAGKNDFSDVFIYGGVMAVLLGWRVAAWRRQGRAGLR